MLTWSRDRTRGGAGSLSNPPWLGAQRSLNLGVEIALRGVYGTDPSGLTSFLTAFNLYRPMQLPDRRRNNQLALASAYQDNCGFHCVIHTLFGLPEDQLLEYAKHNAYQKLAELFCEFYELDPTLFTPAHILSINKRFSHPLDREILWGQVFRNFLIWRLQFDSEKLTVQHLEGGLRQNEEPCDTHLEILCGALNAKLTIHRKFADPEFDLKYDIKAPPPFFEVHIFYQEALDISVRSQYGDIEREGHFDFKYENPFRNKMHNDKLVVIGMKLSPTDEKETLLFPMTNTIDSVEERFMEQRRIVQRVAREVLSAHIGAPSCTLF